ncbi:STAS domain-containing protein [Megalodesulfovibrio gigas]|uniref:Putative Sulfate transporter/antisigma-factor antagonist STAS n=1 Tax=Megalodesulfovibrio gigas (strain ATCC 19364 / DSM 1382 / NCIMB 9332 / VKM B-1759) TaxID=1121448 RepID=T2GFM1_MEGG1|nr:STAS domain-containing protein [Megalodesulfovibrio gigas]AGW14941.1 putative Sulfate transporter/antisigma-factor antagonist STAS [Megalodesulfovibrio gigas DSM 1382 = ATCC 19364]
MLQEIQPILSEHRKALCDAWELDVVHQCGNLVRILEVEGNGDVFQRILDGALDVMAQGQVESGGALTETLGGLSRIMTMNNVSPAETARAIFALRPAALGVLRLKLPPEKIAGAMEVLNTFIDRLGLITLDAYQESRELLISDQQRVVDEFSVPVVKIWDKILLIPLVGMLDSRRTQQMMETLLTAIENTQSKVAILDISGIPIVDTLVARHLIMTASATKLMGSECIITGISARIAKTIIEVGVDLEGMLTRTSLADGLKLAFSITEA